MSGGDFFGAFALAARLGLSGVLSGGLAASGRSANLARADDPISGNVGDNYIPAVQQVLTPAGLQVDLPGLRPQVIRLSPDGKLLAVSGQTSEWILLDPVAGTSTQHVSKPGETAEDNFHPASL